MRLMYADLWNINAGNAAGSLKRLRATEPDLKTPPVLQGVQKMMSLSSFSLKGTGWYATDYKGKKPQAAKPKSTETTATESSSASSDASATVKGTSDD